MLARLKLDLVEGCSQVWFFVQPDIWEAPREVSVNAYLKQRHADPDCICRMDPGKPPSCLP